MRAGSRSRSGKIWCVQIPRGKDDCLAFLCAAFTWYAKTKELHLLDVRLLANVNRSPKNPAGEKEEVREGDTTIFNLANVWTAHQIQRPEWWTV